MSASWMLYGATGYTGIIVAEEAVKRGHAPLLAGRNEAKLRPLARRLGLKYRAFDLDDVNAVAQNIAGMDLVYHAAGPFIHTSDVMIRACLATRAHYLDITGELDVFENTFKYDDAARKIGVALVGGVGFDVVPTDCLANYVVSQVPHSQHLEIVVQALGMTSVTAGTMKSFLEMIPYGSRSRRQGRLVSQALGAGGRYVRLSSGEQYAIPISWGDLATAYYSTGVPNITTYMVVGRPVGMALRGLSPVLRGLSASPQFRRMAGGMIDRLFTGPSAQARLSDTAYVMASADDGAGTRKTAYLETAEGYQFTALAAIHAVEKTLEYRPVGALTPAMAYGQDFVLEIDGTRRIDA